MKYSLSSAVVALALCCAPNAGADEVTLVAPGGIRCPIDRMATEFEQKTGHKVKATYGSGGATHQQVVGGEPFEVSIVQPPYQDVLASGHVVAASETPLASVAVVVVIRKGDPKPDISTPDAVKKMLLAAKALSYPDGMGGRGSATGVSFDETQKKLGIYEQVQAKVKRVQGVNQMQLLVKGEIDVVLSFLSEVNDPGVEVVGPLPKEISTPTAFVGFASAKAKAPDAVKALLTHLSSPEAAAVYKACGMQASR